MLFFAFKVVKMAKNNTKIMAHAPLPMPPAAWRRMLFFLAQIIHIGMGNNNANGLYAFFGHKWPKMAKNWPKSPKIAVLKNDLMTFRVMGFS